MIPSGAHAGIKTSRLLVGLNTAIPSFLCRSCSIIWVRAAVRLDRVVQTYIHITPLSASVWRHGGKRWDDFIINAIPLSLRSFRGFFASPLGLFPVKQIIACNDLFWSSLRAQYTVHTAIWKWLVLVHSSHQLQGHDSYRARAMIASRICAIELLVFWFEVSLIQDCSETPVLLCTLDEVIQQSSQDSFIARAFVEVIGGRCMYVHVVIANDIWS